MAKKTIEIKCTGAGVLKLEDLTPLQGDLKKLDNERYRKLKRVLLEHGFSFPFFVWKSGSKNFILDGHQRDRVLRRLKAQGYTIPALPVDYIEAKDEREAKEKILLLSSQYGEMTEESLLDFVRDADLDLDDLMDRVELPKIDIEKLLEEVENGDGGGDGNGDKEFQVLVECRDKKDQSTMVARLKKQGYKAHAHTVITGQPEDR